MELGVHVTVFATGNLITKGMCMAEYGYLAVMLLLQKMNKAGWNLIIAKAKTVN